MITNQVMPRSKFLIGPFETLDYVLRCAEEEDSAPTIDGLSMLGVGASTVFCDMDA